MINSASSMRAFATISLLPLLAWSVIAINNPVMGDSQAKHELFASGDQVCSHRGVYEVAIEAPSIDARNWKSAWIGQVRFTRPDSTAVNVDLFYDGNGVHRARAYSDQIGTWKWEFLPASKDTPSQSGEFQVVASEFPGKLRVHHEDPWQFQFDSGKWFLHIGDTGYRYTTDTEPEWQEFIDQSVKMGATKIRVWFCSSRHGVEALQTPDREGMNLPYWQEIERRLKYAQESYPELALQLIPYGEDAGEIRRYAVGDLGASHIARYAQARFSSFPNVQWCISNDLILIEGPGAGDGRRRVNTQAIRKIGIEMAEREPWGTLLTNHQSRHSGYAFVEENWSDIVTFEDLDEVAGVAIKSFRSRTRSPIVNDEDRYELYKPPFDPRYFFRRLMWASLLSGGHATYGGLKTYEPYDSKLQGVRGYYTAKAEGHALVGADDFNHIHTFFREASLTLVGFVPDDDCVGADPFRFKCTRDDQHYLCYLSNPSTAIPESAGPGELTPQINIDLPDHTFQVKWFSPSQGTWHQAESVSGPSTSLTAPGSGDWVLLLIRQ